MKNNATPWAMGFNFALAAILIVGVVIAVEQFAVTSEAPREVFQGGTPLPTASEPAYYLARETEAANIFATNAVKLTNRAPLGPTQTPDLRVFHFTQPQRIAGNGVILEGKVTGYSDYYFRRTNEWVGYWKGRVISVVAGETFTIGGAPTGDGALNITQYDADSHEIVDAQSVPSPAGTGSLAIADSQGSLLILTATQQRIYVFDLSKMAFVPVDEGISQTARKIGDGSLDLEISPASAQSPERMIWHVTLVDGANVTVVNLRTGQKEGDWSLSMGNGSSASIAEKNAKEVTGLPADTYMRVFDVRGRTILFVAGRHSVLAYNVDSGQWSSGDEFFSKQPNYMAIVVPEYPAILEEGRKIASEATATPQQSPSLPGYP